MATLYLMSGAPGCGKSTLARQMAAENGAIWLSRDVVRLSMLKEGEDYFAHENQVYDAWVAAINDHLALGDDVIADATHISYPSIAKLMNRIHVSCEVVILGFTVSKQTCMLRNSKREGITRVPDHHVNRMWNQCKDFHKEIHRFWRKGKILNFSYNVIFSKAIFFDENATPFEVVE